MVYRIWPSADFINEEIDLQYEVPPADRSWLDYLMKEEPVPAGCVPTLIRNNRSEPLPAAFDIGDGFWCVGAQVRDRMQGMFGTQVAFHEVPVVVNADNTPLPSTYFVSFSNFRRVIEWSRSKTRTRTVLHQGQEIELISLAGIPGAAVFEFTPDDQATIWIEKSFRVGNRSYSPGFGHVYTTDAAARAIAEAFPERFELRLERRETGKE